MKEIQKAARIIQEGGLVAFPTETVYGLGADALNPMAVARIFEVKKRPQFDPLIVHVADLRQAEILVTSFPKEALKLAERFWPGPLTLVLPKSSQVPDLVTSALPTVALRVPDHPLAQQLIHDSGRPIAAPSANLFGQVSPTNADHVRRAFGDKIEMILDGGPCRVGVESTVVAWMTSGPVLLRPGGISLEEIESVIGKVGLQIGTGEKPLAPGQLNQHYSPRTPISLFDPQASFPGKHKIGFLAFRQNKTSLPLQALEVLSAQGDLREAAANLFAALRRLDDQGLDLILCEEVPEEGLGRAINDRLRKAFGPR
jgi:L-threonylcarbamoyladenylate synthase